MSPFSRGTEDNSSIVISAIFLGMVVLFASWGSARGVQYLADGAPAWMGLFITSAAMLAVSLVLVLASSMGDPTGFGFTRPRVRGGYGTAISWGLVLGLIASLLNLFGGAGGGLSPARGLSFLQIVLLIWLLASVAEEVLVRGYVQSYLEPLSHIGFNAFRLRFSLPVILSALFFSAMHLILLTTNTPGYTVYLIMVFTFFLGLVAAYQRERTGSVLPPIAAHISFNIGGFIGGVVYIIAQIALFGKSAAEVTRALTG
jgi:membrane protease YdiL (CAAX protease family)